MKRPGCHAPVCESMSNFILKVNDDIYDPKRNKEVSMPPKMKIHVLLQLSYSQVHEESVFADQFSWGACWFSCMAHYSLVYCLPHLPSGAYQKPTLGASLLSWAPANTVFPSFSYRICMLPPTFHSGRAHVSVLYMNCGQD
ncbi:LOW QUALITY PROTEIN: hypothetical protein TorRG33x02_037460 [Trema orientale]|uniref:Uncharacterized protein n=1 Tax=Trema orientale TaxID=63057 RepID=A0A2P5FRB1_TREOI|nr:LOW QUALITY PROTEIN: hypothetical protein TorRG33x02_037460 [Trema orientale]